MKVLKMSTKGQISIPKSIRDKLLIKEGDQFDISVEGSAIVLRPVVSIPRSQKWFWTDEIQEMIKSADKNYKEGKYKEYSEIENLTQDMRNKNE